jgi:hypothetical protein
VEEERGRWCWNKSETLRVRRNYYDFIGFEKKKIWVSYEYHEDGDEEWGEEEDKQK